jgi:two-component system chemotaxis response regulator CheB
MTIRVLVVDDSSFIRRAVVRMLAEDAGISVVGQAAHGTEAIALVHACAPDVITLDLEMPEVGGLDTLRRIMAERPTPIVLLSVHARVDAARTLEALAAGAVDFVDKSAVSPMGVHALGSELIRKVRLAASSRAGAPAAASMSSRRAEEGVGPSGVGAIVVGASTGGPAAIQRLLGRLPGDFPLPVLVVQHMPAPFTRAFAERLGACGALPAKEAEDGDPFRSGIFVAPGGRHVELRRGEPGLVIAVTRGVPGDLHVPSLDVAATSAANARGPAVCLVVLTGMGSDGLEGARAVRARGGVVVAQDEESSVIYGMPRAVVRAGLADSVLPLERIADLLVRVGRRHAGKA